MWNAALVLSAAAHWLAVVFTEHPCQSAWYNGHPGIPMLATTKIPSNGGMITAQYGSIQANPG